MEIDPSYVIYGIFGISAGAGVALWRAFHNLDNEVEMFHAAGKLHEEVVKKTGLNKNKGGNNDGYASYSSYYKECYKKCFHDSESTSGHGESKPSDLPESEGDDVTSSSSNVQKLLRWVLHQVLHRESASNSLRTSYIAERLYIILCSVHQDNQVRLAPPITALHAMASQRHAAALSISFFRAVIPSVLVLGILGTLLGVDNTLPLLQNSESVTPMARALEPGAIAVFCTVILLVCRRFYTSKWTKFLCEIDDFTITTLLPFLQPRGLLDVAAENAQNQLRVVLGEEVRPDEWKDSVKRLLAAAEIWKTTYLSNKVGGVRHFVEEILPYLVDLLIALAECRSKFLDRRDKLSNRVARLQDLVSQYDQTVGSRYEKMAACCAKAEELLSVEREMANKLLPLLREVQGIKEKMGSARENMPEEIGDILVSLDTSLLLNKLETLSGWCGKQEYVMSGITAQVESAKESLDSIRNSGQRFEKACAELNGYSAELVKTFGVAEQSKEWCADLWNDSQEVSGKIDQVQASAQDNGKIPDMYPHGWGGMRMKLRDIIRRIRGFLYGNAYGRLLMVISGLLFVMWMLAPFV